MGTATDNTGLCNRATTVRACHVSSVGLNVRAFFRGQFAYLQQHGFRYTVIASEPTRRDLWLPDETDYVSVPITRSVTPLRDLRSVWRLYRIFRRGRFDLVQYTTPKGALLGSVAAFLARVPVRLYLLWGIYYVAQRGWRRRFLKLLDCLTCRLSTHVTLDGEGIRQFAITEGLCSPEGSDVIGKGGDNGIDLERFDPDRHSADAGEIRLRYGIPADAVVIGTVCRLVGDKGINELAAAFDVLAASRPNLWLLLVGPREERDAPRPDTLRTIEEHPRIVETGEQHDVLGFYAAMDLFCLPTYREGFSAVTLEAQAMRLPVVTTDTIGAGETIDHGRTGFAVPVGDVERLTEALGRLVDDAGLRRDMGQAGREFVAADFEQQTFWAAVRKHREDLVIQSGGFCHSNAELVRRR